MSLLVQKQLVSTIIPVHNRPELVVDAVESVLAQTHRPIEILIVDDGSTDGTPEVIKALEQQHEEIRVFSQQNAGPGAARELGRLNAKGEFIQYLDSDDLLLPNKFSEQIAALTKRADAGVAYGMTETCMLDQETKGVADTNTALEHKAMFPLFIRERWWSTSTPLFRRSTVEEAGPWLSLLNEEDWEYDCRIASLGGRLVFTNTFVSVTRGHYDRLSMGGTTTPEKLSHRAMARAKIFQHAKRYMTRDDRPSDIEQEDWRFFSKYAFLLARQCALAGLTTEARAMTTVSIEARGSKSVQHIAFLKLVKFFGWQRAAKVVQWSGR